MRPGGPGYAELVQLGLAHESTFDKETVFLRAVCSLGFSLPVELKTFALFAQNKRHTCVPVRSLAELMIRDCPHRLLAGHSLSGLDHFQALLERFWTAYKVYNPHHAVFRDKVTELRFSIPIKLHTDEGTGLRKTAIFQCSWGPVLFCNLKSRNRYFFWSCAFNEQYKKHNAGFEQGNRVLDDLISNLVPELEDLYRNGLRIENHHFFLVLAAIEGDLPAQAKLMHCYLAHNPSFPFLVLHDFLFQNLLFVKCVICI